MWTVPVENYEPTRNSRTSVGDVFRYIEKYWVYVIVFRYNL